MGLYEISAHIDAVIDVMAQSPVYSICIGRNMETVLHSIEKSA